MKKTAKLLVCIALATTSTLIYARERENIVAAEKSFDVAFQNKEITINAEKLPLREVMKMVSVQSDYRFVYNNRLIDVNQIVSLKISSRDINTVLSKLFEGTDIDFRIFDKQIALSPSVRKAAEQEPKQQMRKVKGRVADSNGEPLPGADVFVDGTSNGTITDSDGYFTILVPEDPETVLVFNFIGMKQTRTKIEGIETFEIEMTDDTQFLEEVVVTGYQSISRERSAGSFALVGGAEVQDKGNARGDILQALEGTVAGLNVNTSGEGTSYLIRGVTSINSSREPLFIVDGVPMSASAVTRLVNPNDVASVSFLKDATAASIWGAKAANGVMVISTASGKQGGKLSINYNGSFTFKGKPIYSYRDVMISRDFIKTASEVFPYMSFELTTTEDGYANIYSNCGPEQAYAYKWQKDIFRADQNCCEWNHFASCIYPLNIVINEVMSCPEGSQEEKLAIQSEARMMRAYLTFMMAQFFGAPYDPATAANEPCIPLLTVASTSENSLEQKRKQRQSL